MDGELSRGELREKSGVSSSTSGDILKTFEIRGWVINNPAHQSTKYLYTITPQGRRALKNYEAGKPDLIEGPKAESRTIASTVKDWNLPTVYTRNNGNTHIRSHGYGC